MLIVCLPNVKLAGICVKIVWAIVGKSLNKLLKLCVPDYSKIWAKVVDSNVKSWNKGSNVACSNLMLIVTCKMVRVVYNLTCKIVRVPLYLTKICS